MSLRLNGSTSGYTELDAGAVAGNNTIKMPTSNGSAYQVLRNGATAGTTEFADKIVSGTAVASTSGTSIDFTGIPSWVKRVTVMLAGVSTSGTSNLLMQIGSGSVTTSGYASGATGGLTALSNATATAGFVLTGTGLTAANTTSGHAVVALSGSNLWVLSGILNENVGRFNSSAGTVTLSGTLDRIRITTVNGTDAFDAGTINILYE